MSNFEPPARRLAREMLSAALHAVRPAPLVERAIVANRELSGFLRQAKRILIVGGGKAGAGMVVGVETAIADRLDAVYGLVNVPDNTVVPTCRVRLNPARPAGLNEPTTAAAHATEEMLQLVGSAGDDDLVIALVSGGGSALMPAPVMGVTLDDKIRLTRLLSASGATISEANCVRKHLSRVKGGRLAEAAGPAAVWGLIISDVPGDLLDVVASGPTVADPTTYADAVAVIEKYNLGEAAPPSTIAHLHAGNGKERPETVKQLSERVKNLLIGCNDDALHAAQRRAEAAGYRVENFRHRLTGEVRKAAREVADQIRAVRASERRCCLLYGGEVTVSLGPSPGLGGRNQEFTLACGAELGRHGISGVTILSAGTDGEDGPTDAAGGVIDEQLFAAALRSDLDPQAYLQRHDSYHYLEPIGGLIRTGLTGTNVTDLRIVLIDEL